MLFHHHCQVHLEHYFDQDQMSLLMHEIESRYFINWVESA